MIDGKLLQANLNHARRAQDLFYQTIAERGIGLAAEPYRVPDKDPNWLGNPDGSVVIVRAVATNSPPSPTCRERGRIRRGQVGTHLHSRVLRLPLQVESRPI